MQLQLTINGKQLKSLEFVQQKLGRNLKNSVIV